MGNRQALCAAGLIGLLALAACGSSEPRLLNLRDDEPGPDEFAILPNKPLEEPASYAELPPPIPGAPNRGDPTPEADAAIALGGDGSAVRPGRGVSDPVLVAQASRFGRSSDIRSRLASEDLEFRRANDGRLLERVFNVNVYFDAYRRQSLDQHRELERFRRAGIRTPAAPPQEAR